MTCTSELVGRRTSPSSKLYILKCREARQVIIKISTQGYCDFSIDASHPCVGVMLVFSASF
ncbi:uncharacterized protein PHALS_15110 [Plasmopara halstedii]|uniref:Uncharacterized protein n=1 Tax=Plasmopara halstedii TaxID=4781 RepID=A0A0P1B8A5_PLAHL|nr:uncharacterized protein PHALS_15110 [Plasmopara halstedii]CEG50477.1 hypothetical protein PHALS_15110 [Plasmopara halstedii]|eukprot:XP_024586846.1 hypothetical protein PHALS_15110 [Plasmopara halstedii]